MIPLPERDCRIMAQYAIHGIRVFFPKFWLDQGGIHRSFFDHFRLTSSILCEIAEEKGFLSEYRRYRKESARLSDAHLWHKFDRWQTDDMWLATRLGKTDTILKELTKDKKYLTMRDEYDNTILYYATFCGHFCLVDQLLRRGAVCDWDRTMMSTSNNEIKMILKRHLHLQRAARTIQKHMHNWLWRPITRDGKLGINARLMLKEFGCNVDEPSFVANLRRSDIKNNKSI